MRNVATGIVCYKSVLLCIYLCFLFAGVFWTACFWRNKDAYISVSKIRWWNGITRNRSGNV